MTDEYVFTHASNCNDYTGCQDECGVHRRDECEYINGAWRHVNPRPSLRAWLDKKFGKTYMP